MSNFARDLLERIHYEPVFDVQNVNHNIYSMVPVLTLARVRLTCVLLELHVQCIYIYIYTQIQLNLSNQTYVYYWNCMYRVYTEMNFFNQDIVGPD